MRSRVSAGAPQEWHDGYEPETAPLVRSLLQIPWPLHLSRWIRASLGADPWSREEFDFGGRRHRYFDHRRNFTWLTERRVELSLALDFVRECAPEGLLEVGAVLPQFGVTGHTVVDRFERGTGVLNVDIAEFRPGRTFDRIVSVSTFEHVGWDETPRRRDAAVAALRSVVGLLAAGGVALVTVPAGHNRALDAALAAGERCGFRWQGLVRVDRANRWRPADPKEALGRRYGEPYLAANGLLVGVAGAS